MHGTNMRILRVENGWRLILGDWQLDTDGEKPTEKVAVDVGQLLAIVGAWAEPHEPPKSAKVQDIDSLRNQPRNHEKAEAYDRPKGPVRPPVGNTVITETMAELLRDPKFAEAMVESVQPPANEPHGFDAVTGEPKQHGPVPG